MDGARVSAAALTLRLSPSARRDRIVSVDVATSHSPRTAHAAGFTVVADAGIHLACGAALVGTLVLPWAQRGNASTLTGNHLAGFLLTNGHRLAAFAIYALAVVGCLVIAAAASERPLVRAASAMLAFCTAAGLLVVGALGPLPLDRWGAAPALGTGGATAIFVVELRFLLRRPRERHAVMP
jgi:hypothetical protein